MESDGSVTDDGYSRENRNTKFFSRSGKTKKTPESTSKMRTDSEGYTTDEGKRKREKENEEEERINKERKKTVGSPEKPIKKSEDKLDQIMQMLTNLTVEVKQIREDQRAITKELEGLKLENQQIKEDNVLIKKENEEIKAEMKQLLNRTEQIEREKKRNNIVVSGINMNESNPIMVKDIMDEFLQQKLQIEVNTRAAYRLGPKICLVEMESAQDKAKVMQNKAKLKRTEERIYIDNDKTQKEREIEKQIRQLAKEARNEGIRNVKVGYLKLSIDGKEWRWNKDKEALQEVSRESMGGKQSKN